MAVAESTHICAVQLGQLETQELELSGTGSTLVLPSLCRTVTERWVLPVDGPLQLPVCTHPHAQIHSWTQRAG